MKDRYTPPYWDDACRDLARRDEVLAQLIEKHQGDQLRGSGDAFQTLLNAVVGQQISVAAAQSIWGRLKLAAPEISPSTVLELGPDELRAIGLSRQKVLYIQGIARAFSTGDVTPRLWQNMSDEEIHAQLCSLYGVGPWTADMTLIFFLHRPNILPLGDIGLIHGAARLYNWDSSLSRREETALLKDLGETWHPWRTVATWYIWRDIDAEPVIY
ncbi:DNA-3-methyladenine glycosylase II [Alkalispirochaeta americana]|uniref:DNA-3-methyladenine glycosylase II n=1 Tax=Alkalispirochaeta americana TaxID=159291 RepID=A0A1N6ULZ3_9SPIO|nr:DNA-3-methyladenine glycosylase [Alkalispirochaeta americana]SIQ66668.1 DNA-3-methyladenine glycosylase II [Alkalispirochaeta americana]